MRPCGSLPADARAPHVTRSLRPAGGRAPSRDRRSRRRNHPPRRPERPSRGLWRRPAAFPGTIRQGARGSLSVLWRRRQRVLGPGERLDSREVPVLRSCVRQPTARRQRDCRVDETRHAPRELRQPRRQDRVQSRARSGFPATSAIRVFPWRTRPCPPAVPRRRGRVRGTAGGASGPGSPRDPPRGHRTVPVEGRSCRREGPVRPGLRPRARHGDLRPGLRDQRTVSCARPSRVRREPPRPLGAGRQPAAGHGQRRGHPSIGLPPEAPAPGPPALRRAAARVGSARPGRLHRHRTTRFPHGPAPIPPVRSGRVRPRGGASTPGWLLWCLPVALDEGQAAGGGPRTNAPGSSCR